MIMKTAGNTIPYVPVLDALDLSSNEIIMEEHSLRLPIMTNNWSDQYPYLPISTVDVAYSSKGLYLRFYSRGKGLRAQIANDGDRVHQDSCVEAFVQLPGDSRYFNFEFNCIGTCDASYRYSREESTPFTPEQYSLIERVTTERRDTLFERPNGVFPFCVSVLLRFEVLGIHSMAELPDCIMANFYKCGDLTTAPHFGSWQPIDAPRPDFHRPEFFKPLYFEDQTK